MGAARVHLSSPSFGAVTVPLYASLRSPGRAMKLAGVTLNQFIKTGLLAVLFILLFKYIAVKSNVPGLQAVAGAV